MKFNIPVRKAIYELKKDIEVCVQMWRPRNNVFHKYACKKFPTHYVKYSGQANYTYKGGLILDIIAGCRFRFVRNNNETYLITFSRQINKDKPYDHAVLNVLMKLEEFQQLEVERVS